MREDLQRTFLELAGDLDGLIKAGKMGLVLQKLAKLNIAQVPRDSRAPLAKICRRVGAVSLGLRLLQPVIREEKSQLRPATALEQCEYAVLLSRNGSIQEALDLLEKVDEKVIPEAYLYLAYCHITDWNYAKAIPLLEKFVQTEADAYSRLIARVNLTSAYLSENLLEQAEALLTETVFQAEKSGSSRLLANCFELQGQLHFQRRDFSLARQSLERATGIFKGAQSYDSIFILKWNSLMAAFENNSVVEIEKFRQAAVSSRQWQNVREADLYKMKIKEDARLLDFLTFGTPMVSYRQRILQELGPCSGNEFVFGSTQGACLDISNGFIDGKPVLNPGKKVHQLIRLLLKDFYVPRNLGTLFADLYPDEYFNINSSPTKVRQLLKEGRKLLKENDLPASIDQIHGNYRFSVHGEFGVRLRLENPLVSAEQLRWIRLRDSFSKASSFSAKEACDRLNLPRSSFLVVVEEALRAGNLDRIGVGKATMYRIKGAA